MKWNHLGMVLAIATSVRADNFASDCPSDAKSACYKVNVPDATASGTQKDIYFQIQGPSTLQWIGLGQGSQMKNSNIFIIYADASGTNVTLSPRLGVGEVEPDFNKDAQVSLLEGSGIANGKMTANVRCSSCADWGSGTMDFTSSKTQWIWAVKQGDAIKSSSQDYSGLAQHDSEDSFTWDLTVAKGGNSLNPFSTQTAASGTASSASSPTSTATSGSSGSSGSSESGSYGASSDGPSGEELTRMRARTAHGAIMGLAFALFFPLGSILIRIFNFSGLIWVHAAAQLFAYALSVVGLGLGIFIATGPYRRTISDRHPIIGLVVICLLVFQPFLGVVHHNIFKRSNRRTFWSTAHVWFGRVLITLGIINGGLGLKLSSNTRGGEIAYGVVAGVMWLIWMVVAVAYEARSKGGRKGERGEKALGSNRGSEDRIRGRGGDGIEL